MKLKMTLMLALLGALAVPLVEAAEVEIPGNSAVSGSVTATSFICSGTPCIDPAGISAGTAGIDISGNAASAPTASAVTDGVYTSGSYANPAWLTSLNISKIDGIITPAKIGFYNRVAIVAKTGGDYTDPATAMSSAAVSAWCGTPSAANPCLLKIMPGVYTVTSPVVMQSYIDIEGSGEKVTKITSTLVSTFNPHSYPENPTVLGATDSEIRFLTIENTGIGSYIGAMTSYYVKSSLTHVTVVANGAGPGNRYGIFISQYLDTFLKDVTVEVSGGAQNRGISLDRGSATLINVSARATTAGTANNTEARGISIYSYPHPSYLPTLTNVTAIASGGQYTYGIILQELAQYGPKLYRVTATASAGRECSGINSSNSSPTMTAVTATASGCTSSNRGVFTYYSGGANPVVKINHSVLKGTKSIDNFPGVTTYVGNTQLDGTAYTQVAPNTALTCVSSYSGTYTALNNLCQP